MKKIIVFTFCLALIYSDYTNAQVRSTLIAGATIHIGNGKVLTNGAVEINKDGTLGIIEDATIQRPNNSKYDTVIYASGKHVYPGFIAPNNILGLTDVDAVRATRDFNEIGGYNPHVRSVIAYNTDTKIMETVRFNGVLLTEATPRGGVISGTSSLMKTDGWNWEDALIKADIGVHLNFPNMHIQKVISEDELGPIEKNKDYEKQMNTLRKFFADAKAYNLQTKHEENNVRFEAMKGIFDGTKILFIHADYIKDITEAISFSKTYNVKRVVLVGGRDSYLATELLKQNNIPVIVDRVHALPDKRDNTIDQPVKLPALLQKAGILYCLSNAGDMQAANTRNLPFQAGATVAYGVSKEDALTSITLNTAKILGIENQVGSLEKGKDANLIISEGDALDMRTNNISAAFINGVPVNLNTQQKELYERYKAKYGVK